MESIQRQRLKVRESQRLNRLLISESTKNAVLISQLRSIKSAQPPLVKIEAQSAEQATKSPLSFLAQVGDLADGSASAPITTTAAFTLSQMPALQTLLSQLKPQLQALDQEQGRHSGLDDEETKSARRQRVEYIEGQTRRHLETVAGLELGKDGEVIDGEWQGQGRRLNRGEVEDLEKAVQMLSSQNRATRDER